jgi:23S rRNA pseudouridine1911/1915/1917 synthase
LDGVIRTFLNLSWAEARRLITSGKISIAGETITDTVWRVREGASVELRRRAPRPETVRSQRLVEELPVYVDASVIVVRKPAGVSTVPYGDADPREQGETLDVLVRDLLARLDRHRGRAPIGVVQRLDKATSGLLVFARSFAAKKHLAQQLRHHSMRRVYLAIAHGDVSRGSFRSRLLPDRGDGLRGSGQREEGAEGQLAITHVKPVERLRGATLIECQLETGRTHQIRIHLSEAGHPLLGEQVYIRGYKGLRIQAPRLMLHAAELGFEHPSDGRPMLFKEPPPPDFMATLHRLRG